MGDIDEQLDVQFDLTAEEWDEVIYSVNIRASEFSDEETVRFFNILKGKLLILSSKG